MPFGMDSVQINVIFLGNCSRLLVVTHSVIIPAGIVGVAFGIGLIGFADRGVMCISGAVCVQQGL